MYINKTNYNYVHVCVNAVCVNVCILVCVLVSVYACMCALAHLHVSLCL